MIKNYIFLVGILFLITGLNAQSKLTIDLSKTGIPVSPTHYGIFFEDINHAADGGLYAELIKNRSFEDASSLTDWYSTVSSGAYMSMSIDNTNLLNGSQKNALKLVVTLASSSARAGVYNTGFWGINLIKGQQYNLFFLLSATIYSRVR